jgi:hypothetical protein
MTYEEKFNTSLALEESGITVSDLENLQNAIYMKDQERVNSEFAWMHEPLEKIGITPECLKSVLRWIYNF